jgi:hypothetical protein
MTNFQPLPPETVNSERETYFVINDTGITIDQDESEYNAEAQHIKLTPRAAWDLLELLYKHRKAIYYATHLALPGTPEWVGDPQRSSSIDSSKWNEPDTSTIHLTDGRTVQANVNGLTFGKTSGWVFVEGREIEVEPIVDQPGAWRERS